MKKNILQKKNEHKRRLFSRRYFIIGVAISVLLIYFISNSYIKNIQKKTNKEFYEYCISITLEDDTYEEEIVQLNKYLKDWTLSDINKGIASNTLAVIYGLSNQTQESIAYMCQSMFYFEKEHQSFSLLNISVNLSAVLINTTAYDKAEAILQSALDIPLEGEQGRLASVYIYTNLAENASQRGDYEQALEAIELAESKLKDTDEIDECRKSLLISEAKSYFGLGKFEECRKILESINQDKLNENMIAVVSYAIPFYEVASMLALYDGDLEAAYEYFDLYLKACDSHSFNLLKLSYIDEFVALAEEYGYGEEAKIKEHRAKMPDYYRAELKETNENNADIVLEAYNSSMVSLSLQNEQSLQKLKVYRAIVVVFLVMIIVSVILIQTYRRSQVDFLTGAYNRRKLRGVYRKLVRKKQDFYAIMFDIDNFKQCNDVYGHRFGDTVLERISRNVMEQIPKTSMFFRYGGEEFVTLCEYKTEEEMHQLAERVRKTVEALVWENESHITISVGVATSFNSEEVVRTADECLYKSKKTGKNRVTYDTD